MSRVLRPRPDPDWTGALLVGGSSRRMGTDKLRLPLADGRRLVDLPAAALRAVCAACFLVGEPAGGPLELEGFEPLADAASGQGPLAGLVAALEHARSPWLLLLAGDLPCVDAGLLAALQAEAAKDPARALLPASERGLEPLAAAYPVALAPRLRACLERGERAMHRALGLELRRIWAYAEARAAAKLPQPFRNLNAPVDWESFSGGAPVIPTPPRA